MIVVDDGSTDDSAAIVRSFDGVRYIRQENQGPAAARNAGIAVAEGEFLAFSDSDDIVLPHKLTVQVGYLLDHPELSGVLARQEWITPPPNAVRDLVWGDVDGVQPLSLVIRRAAMLEVGSFQPGAAGPRGHGPPRAAAGERPRVSRPAGDRHAAPLPR